MYIENELENELMCVRDGGCGVYYVPNIILMK